MFCIIVYILFMDLPRTLPSNLGLWESQSLMQRVWNARMNAEGQVITCVLLIRETSLLPHGYVRVLAAEDSYWSTVKTSVREQLTFFVFSIVRCRTSIIVLEWWWLAKVVVG